MVAPVSAEDRLARIAESHRPLTGIAGFVDGDCRECGWRHPCPTYVWATTDRDVLATWDPRDDEMVE